MKKIKVFLIILVALLALVGCNKPAHEHNYIDGVCECGDTIIVKYNVTFLDAEGNTLKVEEVVKNQSATAPEAPTKEGFEFKGWDVDFNNVTSNLTVRPIYEEIIVIEYSVELKVNGGSLNGAPSEITYTDYTQVELPVPTRDNYVFLGWYLGKEKIEKLEKNANYTLKAQWECETYSIVYNLDGGSFEGEYPVEYQYSVGTVLVNPVKEGYKFLGWYLNSNFGGLPQTKIEGSKTGEIQLFAKWEVQKPIITYNLNGGNWDYSNREELTEDLLKDIMAYTGVTSKPDGMVQGQGPTQVGFANKVTTAMNLPGFFSHETYGPKWSWLRSYIISVADGGTKSSLSSNDSTFWRYTLGAFIFEEYRSEYPISPDFTQDALANGFWDELSMASVSNIELDDSCVLKVPVRIYYVFQGWYLDAEFNGEPIATATDACEVYAKWIEEVPVSNIAITNKIESIDRFQTHQLTWALEPLNAAIKSVEFSSSNEEIATVNDKGLVTFHQNGEVTITVTSLSPSGVSDSMTVVVTSPDHFDISYETNSYMNIGQSINLLAQYIKRDTSTVDVTWMSLNQNIATVDNAGKVTGVASGVATIRASLVNDETTYFDFVVTVLPENLPAELLHIVNSHESNIFTRYELGIGSGTPVYYSDILGGVNRQLFNYDYFWNTEHKEGVMATGNWSEGLTKVEFITVHYTAGMSKGSDAEATSIYFKNPSYAASAHFCTGNDGVFQCLDLDVKGWHAGDGANSEFEWTPTGVKYNESDPQWPEWGISSNSMFTINGHETSVKVPYKEQRGSEGYVTDSKWLNDQGLAFKVVNGEYYMGTTWWCYSNVWEGRICSRGGNKHSIGIESCVDEGSDLWLTWQITARLVADLMVRYNLDITRVVGHHFFAAKDCPQPLLENDLEIWWEFIDLVETEYETMTTYKDVKYTFTSNSEYVNEYGRIVEQPEFSQVVTYEVKLADGTSVTLASAVPGIYNK